MGQNDLVLLKEILRTRNAEVASELPADDFFEIFSAEQILKDYDLSYDELSSGLVGKSAGPESGSRDGGIDSLYLFINGELVQADTDLTAFKKDITLEWVVIQSKTSRGFQEEPINKLRATLEEALNFEQDISSLSSVYNRRLIERMSLFRETYKTLAPRFPKLNISINYASFGDEVHQNVSRKVVPLKEQIVQALSGATVEFNFVGAPKLLSMARRLPPTSFGLSLAENPISTGSEGFLCLVRLANYYSFITDDSGRLQRHLFEANVRDYQGSTEVNEGIRSSLESAPEDFWWLNNGITIIASQVMQH